MTADEIKTERTRLLKLQDARTTDGKPRPGFTKNIAAIQAALYALDKEQPEDV